MTILFTVARLAVAFTLVFGVTQCGSRKAKPVKVEKKDPPSGNVTPGGTTPGGTTPGGTTPGGTDPGATDPGGSQNGGGTNTNPNGGQVTPQPSPSPTPPVTPTPTPNGGNNGNNGGGPVNPPAGGAADEITVTLSDGTTKVIKWNGLEHFDSTGKFKITNQ